MKLYCITEGKTEEIVFKHWIPFVLYEFKFREFINIDKICDNEFTIVNGGGYYKTLSLIPGGIEDVNQYSIDRLLIQVDADEKPVNEVIDELKSKCDAYTCTGEIFFIVCKPCFEAWCLGNKKIPKPNPIDEKAKLYHSFYNVLVEDPQLIPPFNGMNSSQFAFEYLKAILRDRRQSYRKNDPKSVCPHFYFDQVHSRSKRTKHISTFEMFLNSLRR